MSAKKKTILEIDPNELNSTRLRSGRQFKKPTKLNRSELDSYKQELIIFEIKLKKILFDLTNSAYFINEECSEIRRQIQLNKEELVMQIKQSNGLNNDDDDDDDEEIKLSIDIQLKINEIDYLCVKMIESVDTYEQDLNKAFILNEKQKQLLNKEIKLLQKQTNHWIAYLNDKKLINDTELNKMKKDLFNFSTENLCDRVKSLILNNTNLKYFKKKDDENEIGQLFLKESIQLDNESVLFNENEMINYFINLHVSDFDDYNAYLKYERLENGTYVISYSSGENKFLVIYDPESSQILKKINLDKNLMKMMTAQNKIAIICWFGSSWWLRIMDEMLNFKFDKKIDHYHLAGVDTSFLYCIRDKDFSLILFDWSLNEIKTNVKLQYTNSKQAFFIPFYIPLCYIQIIQLKSMFIVRLDTWFDKTKKCLLIFDEIGNTVKMIEVNGEFKIDSHNNIIILIKDENKLVYYDAHGSLFKEVNLKCFKQFKILKLYINSNDKLYFSVKK